MVKFRRVAVGGTFDSLHKGHVKLLREAFLRGEEVVIGLSTERLAGELHKTHRVDSYESRKKAVVGLLEREGLAARARIVPIDCREGLAAEVPDLDAILVSPETLPGATRINELRRWRGLNELKVISVEWVMAENGKPVSTTRIRVGEIDREGRALPRQ